MSNEGFRVWSTAFEPGMCVIEPPSGVKKSWQLSEGVSRVEGWPTDAACAMSDDFPDDIDLSDNVHGADVFVVSKPLKEFLAAQTKKSVEFLPVRITNHKGRVASKDYFIMNALELVDCLDEKASGVTWNNIDKESISSCKRLVIEEQRVPKPSKLFRLKQWPETVLVASELADELAKKGFTGLHFIHPRDYTGI